jgi:uncharacterized membrane protein YfcA
MATDLTLFALAAVLAGSIASVAGFGIGSVLTPLLTRSVGAQVAVTLVALPHLAASLLRAWRHRAGIDRAILLRFGAASALGGLAGAALHTLVHSRALEIVFAALLLFVGVTGVTGLAEKIRFGPVTSWIAGVASGLLGGMVGNQGGIRAGALLGLDVDKRAFIATSTAVGVVVDLVRVPIYVATGFADLRAHAALVGALIVGALAGTLLGELVWKRVPERAFKRVVSALVLALGVAMVVGLVRA